jgi:hypothetical protein
MNYFCHPGTVKFEQNGIKIWPKARIWFMTGIKPKNEFAGQLNEN